LTGGPVVVDCPSAAVESRLRRIALAAHMD
jgi:hypothetical protein